VKVRVCGLKDLKCSQPGHLLWELTPPARTFVVGESAFAAASSEAAFVGIAEAAATPIRLIPNTPTAARMIRIARPPW
jgi:hypothetical protein